MSVRRLSTSVAAALFTVTTLATPAAAAHTVEEADPYVYGFTFDRLWSGIAALLAIGSVILGGWLLARGARRTPQANRKTALIGFWVAVFAVVNGALVVLTSDAGPGSGNGIVGGYIAAILGLVGAVLNWLALARSRRAAPVPPAV